MVVRFSANSSALSPSSASVLASTGNCSTSSLPVVTALPLGFRPAARRGDRPKTARTLALRVDPTYSAVVAELDRRASNRKAHTSRVLSVVSLAIALAALVVTALKA